MTGCHVAHTSVRRIEQAGEDRGELGNVAGEFGAEVAVRKDRRAFERGAEREQPQQVRREKICRLPEFLAAARDIDDDEREAAVVAQMVRGVIAAARSSVAAADIRPNAE
jgi:hypothetical protein